MKTVPDSILRYKIRDYSGILIKISKLKYFIISLLCLSAFSNKTYSQERLKIAVCQFPVSGDLKSNSEYIKKFIKEAALNKADIIQFPEAALTGYPP